MKIINKTSELKSKSDEIVNILKDIPYSKVDSYINDHVTSLPTARTYLKKMTKLILYLIKEI